RALRCPESSRYLRSALEGVGRVSLREAVRLGASRVAFAPLIRDQGNSKIGTGDVEQAVTRGMLLGDDTEKRLQKEGLAKPFAVGEGNGEAGPDYCDEAGRGVKKTIEEAKAGAPKRPPGP